MSNLRTEDSFVRAESNLEEYPLFAVKARNRDEDQLVFERRRQGEDGTELVQRWEVEPPAKLGMPGPFDQDVYLAVLQLLEMRGGMPRNGELRFSLYELRKILGWTTSGNTYEKIRQSLRRISSTTLTSENAFYSKAEARFLSDTFQVWSVHFSRTKQGGSVRERHALRFHPIFLRNYIAQYLKGLDSEFYWSLPSPLSKRLYRLVDHQRDGELSWDTDLFALGQQIPLPSYTYPSEIRRALEPAHKELIDKGFLAGVDHEGKLGVFYRVSREFARRQKARELSGDPRELFAIERLTSEGVRGDVSRNLVARHGSEKCLRYADALDHQRGIRNRAGWLRKAIEQGFELPDTLPLQLFDEPRDTPRERTGHDAPAASAPRETLEIPPSSADEQESGIFRKPEVPPQATAVPDTRAQEVWAILVEDLVAVRGREALPPWFGDFEGGELEGSTLTILVPNSTAANHLNENFGGDLLRLWRERTGEEGTLEVTLDLASGRRAALGDGSA